MGEGLKFLEGEVGPREVCFWFWSFFKKDEIIACLCADGSDPVDGKTVMQKKERIINPYYLNRIWELVWNFATTWNGFCGKIFDFDIGKLQISSNPTHL